MSVDAASGMCAEIATSVTFLTWSKGCRLLVLAKRQPRVIL